MGPLLIPAEELDHKDREARRVRVWHRAAPCLPFVLAESFADRIDGTRSPIASNAVAR
jgi:hypothetical protein